MEENNFSETSTVTETAPVKPEKKKSGLATAGLVLGIIGLVLSFIPLINTVGIILGILAFVFSLVALFGKRSVGKAVAALILGILAIVISIVMKTATVKAIDEAVKDVDSSLSDITGDNTDSILKNNLDVTFGKFIVEDKEFISSCKLPVTVKNKGTERKSFSIQIEAVDKAGNRIESDSVYVDTLGAGQAQNLEAFTLITSDQYDALKQATFKIVEVSMY